MKGQGGIMKKLLLLLGVFALTAVTALAADVTGTWRGTLLPPGATDAAGAEPFIATFKQDGDKITGTIGPENQQLPLTTGTITENKLTLTISQGTRGMTLELTLDGDRITGTAARTRDGVVDPQKAKLTLVKAK
jgi:hypothetical protein